MGLLVCLEEGQLLPLTSHCSPPSFDHVWQGSKIGGACYPTTHLGRCRLDPPSLCSKASPELRHWQGWDLAVAGGLLLKGPVASLLHWHGSPLQAPVVGQACTHCWPLPRLHARLLDLPATNAMGGTRKQSKSVRMLSPSLAHQHLLFIYQGQ